MWEFPEIGGGPYNQSPTVLGSILGPLGFRSSQVPKKLNASKGVYDGLLGVRMASWGMIWV